MHRSRCFAFAKARTGVHAFALLFYLMASGCTLSPADGERVSYATNQVTFSGYSSVAGGVVLLEAVNSAGTWVEIGRVSAGIANVNTAGATPLYAYSLAKQVPKVHWRALGTGAAREYRADLRMRIGDTATFTFTPAGQACVYSTLASGTESDGVAVGRKCTTGSGIGLIATAMSVASPSGGAEGWLCAGQGSSCAWRAKLEGTVLGFSGCQPTYQVDVEVKNAGELASDEDLSVNLSVGGQAWNITCITDDTLREGCVQTGTMTYRFFDTRTLKSRVKLGSGQKTIIHVSGGLSVPAYTQSASFEASVGTSYRRWSWDRGAPPSMQSHAPSAVCLSQAVYTAGG